MARYLLEEACPTLFIEGAGQVVRVRIWETDESYAEASLDASNEIVLSSVSEESFLN
jgi:6-pyruvoyltetrahydropterin/6-carboxytetrahydropterin synthase